MTKLSSLHIAADHVSGTSLLAGSLNLANRKDRVVTASLSPVVAPKLETTLGLFRWASPVLGNSLRERRAAYWLKSSMWREYAWPPDLIL